MRWSTVSGDAWIDEDVVPLAKNIYGATKLAAEDLCRLFARNHGLPCIVLRTARFFPEADDDARKREAFSDANLKANEFLHRRADVQDLVDAHLLAIGHAPTIGFGRYVLSATTPFLREDLALLRSDAAAALRRRVPGWEDAYARLGWRMQTLDQCLQDLVKRGIVTRQQAISYAKNKDIFK